MARYGLEAVLYTTNGKHTRAKVHELLKESLVHSFENKEFYKLDAVIELLLNPHRFSPGLRHIERPRALGCLLADIRASGRYPKAGDVFALQWPDAQQDAPEYLRFTITTSTHTNNKKSKHTHTQTTEKFKTKTHTNKEKPSTRTNKKSPTSTHKEKGTQQAHTHTKKKKTMLF